MSIGYASIIEKERKEAAIKSTKVTKKTTKKAKVEEFD